VSYLSAKVASHCFRYTTAVKNAKSDINRLQGELGRLTTTLEGALQLLECPNWAGLQTSQRLRDGLSACSSRLAELDIKLEKKLNHGTARKTMARLGVRALTWPFESKDVDGIIKTMERCRDAVSAALTIDQTYVAAFSLSTFELIRSTVRGFLISARQLFSPNCRLRMMQPSTRTPTSTTHDVIPTPELPSART
jgi:hypothetical protein